MEIPGTEFLTLDWIMRSIRLTTVINMLCLIITNEALQKHHLPYIWAITTVLALSRKKSNLIPNNHCYANLFSY